VHANNYQRELRTPQASLLPDFHIFLGVLDMGKQVKQYKRKAIATPGEVISDFV
jgi:hypothetical protein